MSTPTSASNPAVALLWDNILKASEPRAARRRAHSKRARHSIFRSHATGRFWVPVPYASSEPKWTIHKRTRRVTFAPTIEVIEFWDE